MDDFFDACSADSGRCRLGIIAARFGRTTARTNNIGIQAEARRAGSSGDGRGRMVRDGDGMGSRANGGACREGADGGA
jgi:hypothetical protein